MTTMAHPRAAAALLLLCACPGPSTPDAGADAGPPPSVTSIDPDRGPLTGGTAVTVNGSGFVSGATVTFGTTSATTVTFETTRKLAAVSPPGPQGRASVTVVNPDGRQSTLPSAFLYEGATTGTIVDAVIVNAAAATDSSGADPLRVAVRGEVKVPGVTEGAGRGAGVRAQVGWASEGTLTFTWVDAAFLADADLYDDYSGDVTLPTPLGMTVATYVLGVRFSVDDGATWVEGDRDGSANGLQDAQRPRLTVSRRVIDWCKLGGEQISAPQVFDLRFGEAGPAIYGQVYLPGVTDRAGAGPGISAELGLGDAGTDPALWAYVPAQYNHDTGGNANDEFQATLPTSTAYAGRDRRFAFRFNVGGGPWRYCDSDGLTNGFAADQAGVVSLGSAGIDGCVLQFPLTLQSRQGVVAGTVYGRVRARTVTEDAGAGPGIEAQLGVGPGGTLPTDASWAWQGATYNVDAAGGAEEYQADLVGPAPGAWAYAYRFRYAAGPWAYCDSVDDGALSPGQLGALTARAQGYKEIAACKVHYVSAASVASGDPLTAYGRVRVPGFSEDAGPTPGLVGQVGVGTQGSDPATDPAWGWGPATFNVDVADSGEDEFMATVAPAYSGTRAVAFRFAVDDGGWTTCGPAAPLAVGRSAVPFCVLQHPTAADAGTTIYGQVYVPGVTRDAGAPIVAELGFGRKIEDPGVAASWTWVAATYNSNCPGCGNNNEYQATLSAPPDAGHYAFRFTFDGSICYGDLNGAGSIAGGFSGEAQGGAENLGVIVP